MKGKKIFGIVAVAVLAVFIGIVFVKNTSTTTVKTSVETADTGETTPITDNQKVDSVKKRLKTLQKKELVYKSTPQRSIFKDLFWECMKSAPSKDPKDDVAQQTVCRKKAEVAMKKTYWSCMGEVTNPEPDYEKHCRKLSLAKLTATVIK